MAEQRSPVAAAKTRASAAPAGPVIFNQREKTQMAGYHNYSKSNNALAAESSGLFPASVLAKMLGVKTAAIRALMTPSEWHHTSKHYNVTNYYSEDAAIEIMDDLRAWRDKPKDQVELDGCTGSYLIWSGTRRHPHAKKISFGPVRVTNKGDWFILHLPDGDMRKHKHTRGFDLRDAAGEPLTFN